MKNRPSKDPRGYSSLVFGRDVLPQTLKVDLKKYQVNTKFSRNIDPLMYQSA